MFRKPKNKGTIRQRTAIDWEESESGERGKNEINEEDTAKKPDSKFSFDMDEGADASFKVKKNTKKVEELKRMQKLEEEAEKFAKEEEERKKNLADMVKKEKKSREDKFKETKTERKKYLEKYGDNSAKYIYDEELDIDDEAISSKHDQRDDDVSKKFSSTLGGIPDSKAVYEAKKRRERLRREGTDGYIPLDDDQKLRTKNERGRLIREDENDDSDEEEANRFYSARELLKNEEDRRREEQNEFLNRENGEEGDEANGYNSDDNTMEEWERQQILKAVSGRAIGELQKERRNTAKMFGNNQYIDDTNEMDMDMDIDMDVMIDKPSFNGPSNTGGDIKIEDILAKLKVKIGEREEALNFRREEERKTQEYLDENKQTISKIEMELPDLSTKFRMYQELRIYSRSLLECLNEKMSEINEISDKRRQNAKARCLRLMKRRRQDVRDQYAECSAISSAKMAEYQAKIGENERQRTADREARRRRRKMEREQTLIGISHDEGMSTDDEETNCQMVGDKKIQDEVDAVASVIFADALEEFSEIRKVLGRMMDWLAVDTKAFQDAYVYLCLPKLCSPYVRLELITANILENDVSLTKMPWFEAAIMAGSENIEIERNHEILIGLIPAVVEKVVVPFLIDSVRDEWDPLSVKQTRRLAEFCTIFEKFPTLTEKSKSFVAFLDAIREKFISVIDEDLFVPMFALNALENPATGCKSFHDRQYWQTIKVIRSINELKRIISVAARFELIVEKIVNTSCIVALRSGNKTDAGCARKIRGLFDVLDDEVLRMGGMTSFRQLIGTLKMIGEEQTKAGRQSFEKEIQKWLRKIER